MFRRVPIGVLGVCLFYSGCGSHVDTDIEKARKILSTIPKRDSLQVYEGLPHPRNEKEAFDRERQKKKVVEIHGHWFYEKPVDLKADDTAALVKLLTDDKAFYQHKDVGKKCGGFHPDFCVEWKVNDKTSRVLLCFGCEEAKVHAANAAVLCNIGNAYKPLRALLKDYHPNLPPLEREY